MLTWFFSKYTIFHYNKKWIYMCRWTHVCAYACEETKKKKKKKNNYEYLNWQEARLQVKPTTCSASSASSAQCLECTLEKWVVNFDRTCKNNNKFLMHVHMFLVLLDRSDLSFFQNHMHYDIRFRKPPL